MNKWFSQRLEKWYQANKRDLPWRNETDAYKIWLSEIILQQTQVGQGLAYYYRFIQKFPTVDLLAKAKEDEVLKLWQGLGYYSRARNLHAAAKWVCEVHKAKFPENYSEILSLKGVGTYTAAAIASFAFNLPYAVVDGNVYRFLSRLFGIYTPIDSSLGKKQFQDLANELLDKKSPGLHNQAIMEFGSQYCKPARPDCEHCIFKDKCVAATKGLVAELPIKEKKLKTRTRYFNYLILIDNKQATIVKKRSDNDIWKGLYEFVLIETDTKADVELVLNVFNENKKVRQTILHASKEYRHLLSHQLLITQFIVIKVKHLPTNSFKKVPLKSLEKHAFPRLIEKFLQDCDLKEIV